MKLFLASRINVTLDLITPLLISTPSNLSVAFIATAADTYTDKPWIVEERAEFVTMGFHVDDYDLKNQNQESLRKDLTSYDIVHVAGGNVFYLLSEIKKSGFDQVLPELLESGKIYSGSSAGSMVMGPSIEYIKTVDHPEEVPELTDYTGLGYIKEMLVPHFGREKYAKRHKIIRDEWGDKVTFFSDNQAMIVDGNIKEVVSIKKGTSENN